MNDTCPLWIKASREMVRRCPRASTYLRYDTPIQYQKIIAHTTPAQIPKAAMTLPALTLSLFLYVLI